MACGTQDITIIKGKTFSRVLRWGALPLVYKAITAITKAGNPVITSTSHGLVNGWPVAIAGIVGMTELNAVGDPPGGADYRQATYVDANTISLNAVNAAGYGTYVSGGYLQYYTPVNLSGFTARLQIRPTLTSTGTPLVSLTELDGIDLDNTAKTITWTLDAADTAAYTFTTGVYELEMISGTGVVSRLAFGNVAVEDEVVRS
jgi:hypothetical protein